MQPRFRSVPMPGRTRLGWTRIAGPLFVLLVLLALDTGFFSSFPLFGVRPQLLLVLACTVALYQGPWFGAGVAAVLGLAVDLTGGFLVGLSVLSYSAAALAAGALSSRLFVDRSVIVLTGVAAGTLTEQFVYVVGALAFGHRLDGVALITRLLPGLMAYHLFITPLLYPVGRRLVHWLTAESTDAR